MNIRALVFVIAALSTTLAGAAVNSKGDVIEFIQSEIKERQIPGLQIVVLKNGVPVLSKAFGTANIQYSVPVTKHSVFSINSATKTFTGVAIMQLVDEGKIDLDASVSRYLDGLPAEWQSITVKQLLTHTSGLPDIIDPDNSNILQGGPAAVWKTVQTLPMTSIPGQRFSYNQTNYVLLAKIIEQCGGEPFLQFVQHRQFDVVGMSNTSFGDSFDVTKDKANSYRLASDGTTLKNVIEEFPAYTRAGAGINSNAHDLSKWIAALQQGRLIKPASLDKLWMPTLFEDGKPAPWALGWPTIRRAEHRAVAGIGGARSAFYIYPEDGLTIIILTNLSGAQPEQLIDTVAGFYVPALRKISGGGYALFRLRQRIEQSGYSDIDQKLKQVMEQYAVYQPSPNELNSWGYRLLSKQQKKQAVAVLGLAARLYPHDSNAHDSLAEAYEANKEMDLAIHHYRRSLELNPMNGHATSRLDALR